MKTRIALLAGAALAAFGTAASATTAYGRVVSSTAVMAQVAVAQPECFDQPVVQQRTTGGGALLGALIGGVVGNSIGHGAGRAAATGIGVVTGAAIGDRAEAVNTPPVQTTVRNCRTVTRYENRVAGYDVVYDYAGQRYTTRTAADPGARIALDVSVAPQDGTPMAPAAPAYGPAYGPVYAPVPAVAYPGYGYVQPAVVVAPRFGGYWHRH